MCRLLGLPEDTYRDNLLDYLAERVGSRRRMKAIEDLGMCDNAQASDERRRRERD